MCFRTQVEGVDVLLLKKELDRQPSFGRKSSVRFSAPDVDPPFQNRGSSKIIKDSDPRSDVQEEVLEKFKQYTEDLIEDHERDSILFLIPKSFNAMDIQVIMMMMMIFVLNWCIHGCRISCIQLEGPCHKSVRGTL